MGDGFLSWSKVGLAFVLVLGLLALCAWLLRRFLGTSLMGWAVRSGKRLAVIEALPLDPRHRLILVRQDRHEHLLVIGAGPPLLIMANIEAGIEPSFPRSDEANHG